MGRLLRAPPRPLGARRSRRRRQTDDRTPEGRVERARAVQHPEHPGRLVKAPGAHLEMTTPPTSLDRPIPRTRESCRALVSSVLELLAPASASSNTALLKQRPGHPNHLQVRSLSLPGAHPRRRSQRVGRPHHSRARGPAGV